MNPGLTVLEISALLYLTATLVFPWIKPGFSYAMGVLPPQVAKPVPDTFRRRAGLCSLPEDTGYKSRRHLGGHIRGKPLGSAGISDENS